MNRRSFLRNILAAAVAPAFLPSAIASMRPKWKKNLDNIYIGVDWGDGNSLTRASIYQFTKDELNNLWIPCDGRDSFWLQTDPLSQAIHDLDAHWSSIAMSRGSTLGRITG
jgi:hypothetical protein